MGMKQNRIAATLCLLTAAFPITAAQADPAGLTLSGEAEIPTESSGEIEVDELSGIGWDADEGLAYAVSDHGSLHHLRLTVEDGQLVGAQIEASYALTDQGGEPLEFTDAEDLAVVNGDNGVTGDTELLIVMEDGPSAARFSPRGERLEDVDLPTALTDKDAYAKKNRGLESIALHPTHGLITAPESPISGPAEGMHRLYAADGATWDIPESVPGESRLKAITMTGGGDLLVMERFKVGKGQQEAHLRHVALSECRVGDTCAVTEFSIDGQPALPGNYEGMTALPDGRILMVTDQAAKDGEPTTLTLLAPAAER